LICFTKKPSAGAAGSSAAGAGADARGTGGAAGAFTTVAAGAAGFFAWALRPKAKTVKLAIKAKTFIFMFYSFFSENEVLLNSFQQIVCH
jgi:hypothetical protein